MLLSWFLRIGLPLWMTACRQKMTDEPGKQHGYFRFCYNYAAGGAFMKFKLIIDPSKDEEVRVIAHEPSALTKQIEDLVLGDSGPDKLIGYIDDDIMMLPVTQIECITVLEGKTWAIDRRGDRYRLKQRLYELETQLPPSFIRINKSAFANEARIKKFSASFSGAVDAVFQCGYREYVSRRCFAQIKRRYGL